MAHVRAQIRDAIVTAVTGLGATVKATRKFPTNAAELPRIHVYSMSERIDDAPSNLGTQGRVLSVMIEVVATGAETTLDDTIDDFCVSIENALESSKLSGLALNTALTTTEIDVDSTGKEPIGAARLTFEVIYRTIRGTPQTAV